MKLEAIEETIRPKTIVNNEEASERNETSSIDSYGENEDINMDIATQLNEETTKNQKPQNATFSNSQVFDDSNRTQLTTVGDSQIPMKNEKPQHSAFSKSQVFDDSNRTQRTMVGDTQSSSQRKSSSRRTKSKQKPVRPPSKTDVLKHIVETPTTSITE